MIKSELLKTPLWDYKDIMSYYPQVKSPTTALKIKDRAIKEFDGRVPLSSRYATRDSILRLFGTTAERELEIINGKNQS